MDLYTTDLSPYIAKIMNQTINVWHNKHTCSPIKIAKLQIKAVVILLVELLNIKFLHIKMISNLQTKLNIWNIYFVKLNIDRYINRIRAMKIYSALREFWIKVQKLSLRPPQYWNVYFRGLEYVFLKNCIFKGGENHHIARHYSQFSLN